MKKYPIVEVEWLDSITDGGWRPPEAYLASAAPDQCRSGGYLLKSARTSITLMQSRSDLSGNMTNSVTIPRVAVKSIKRMKAEEER